MEYTEKVNCTTKLPNKIRYISLCPLKEYDTQTIHFLENIQRKDVDMHFISTNIMP
jgi:hypothetical protein